MDRDQTCFYVAVQHFRSTSNQLASPYTYFHYNASRLLSWFLPVNLC